MILGLLLAATTTAPNFLLVTIDTLRADRVGVYGYAAAQTPVLDRLAREGVLLEDAVVQVPQTRPSHASILTGRYPYEHKIRDNYSPPLDPKIPTLATLLKARGYATAAFIGAYPVARPSGLDQGFDVFDDPFGSGENVTTRHPRQERPAGEVADAALAWLGRPRTIPFFAWVHFFDPHAPYEAPAPFGKRFAKSPYDGEIAYADSQLGRLLEWLDRTGTRRQTLVLVTSDHGEGLGEHGEDEHMIFVYDATLRVPALASWPGRLPVGVRVPGQFRSIDILPTVLELLGLPPAATSGASRSAALLAGSRIPDNESYAESLYGNLHCGWAPLFALRGEGYKFIDAPRPELYRLVDDPGETRNIIESRSTVASGMRAHIAVYRKAGDAPVANQGGGVDADAAERLAALGYVGGTSFAGKPTGADPKDKIAEYQAYTRDTQRALRYFHERNFDEAIRIFSRLSTASSVEGAEVVEQRSFLVEYNLGRSLLEKGRYLEAVPHLESALAMDPAYVPSRLFLARALGAGQRPAEALKVVDKGLSRAPDNPELLHTRGSLLLRAGDLAGARIALEAAKGRDPSSPLLRLDLAYLYRNLGDLPRALVEAEEAVRLDHKAALARVEKGLVLGALGREEEAGQEFKSALDMSPEQPDALYYLAGFEMRRGRAAKALPLLERLAKVAPAYPGSKEALAAARHLTVPAVASTAPPSASAPGTLHLRILRVGDRASAREVERRVRAGEDFEALARALSEDASAARGGDLGAVRATDLAEPMRSAVVALGVGETTSVLETSKGFVLLKREK
jgi:arylsulfatase A-like enzyme/tetratricopeptide (TPR) repeat protein